MQGREGPALDPDSSGPFEVTRREARYGLAYLSSLSAQAGYGLSETPPDSDILAVDCTLEMPVLSVRVQVKCTTKDFSKKRRYLSWKVEDNWRKRWADNVAPVYFVAVRIDRKNVDGWLEHQPPSTTHHAAAYWARIDPRNIPTHVRVYETDQLTAATLVEWDRALVAQFKEQLSA